MWLVRPPRRVVALHQHRQPHCRRCARLGSSTHGMWHLAPATQPPGSALAVACSVGSSRQPATDTITTPAQAGFRSCSGRPNMSLKLKGKSVQCLGSNRFIAFWIWLSQDSSDPREEVGVQDLGEKLRSRFGPAATSSQSGHSQHFPRQATPLLADDLGRN